MQSGMGEGWHMQVTGAVVEQGVLEEVVLALSLEGRS